MKRPYARAQWHKGRETRTVTVPGLGTMAPLRAMELALEILDAARAARAAPAPVYPAMFEHEGDALGSQWTRDALAVAELSRVRAEESK